MRTPSGVPDPALAELHDVEFEGRYRRPALPLDPLLALAPPELHGRFREGAGAGRPEDALGSIAALMPAGDDQLVEIDHVVGMQMRQQHGVELGAGAAGAEQPLRHARAAVDQEAPLAGADQARRPEAALIHLRTAGAQERDAHLPQAPRS